MPFAGGTSMPAATISALSMSSHAAKRRIASASPAAIAAASSVSGAGISSQRSVGTAVSEVPPPFSPAGQRIVSPAPTLKRNRRNPPSDAFSGFAKIAIDPLRMNHACWPVSGNGSLPPRTRSPSAASGALNGDIGFHRRALDRDELRICAALRNHLRVRAALNNLSLIEDDDFVRIADGAQTVRDDQT